MATGGVIAGAGLASRRGRFDRDLWMGRVALGVGERRPRLECEHRVGAAFRSRVYVEVGTGTVHRSPVRTSAPAAVSLVRASPRRSLRTRVLSRRAVRPRGSLAAARAAKMVWSS